MARIAQMTTTAYEQTVELTFHNVDYILHAFVAAAEELVVEVEQKSNGNRWQGRFPAQCKLTCRVLAHGPTRRLAASSRRDDMAHTCFQMLRR